MAGQSVLEQLCPELQLKILSYSDSTATLHNLIRASPRLYQIFRSNKEYTLSSLARRQFHRAVIGKILLIDQMSLVEEPPFSRETLLKCSDRDSHLRSEPLPTVLPLSVSIRLCRLDKTVQFFTDDYPQNTLPILAQLKDSTDFTIQTNYTTDKYDPPLHLSDSELDRLRTAFCRFEIYRQLNARCSSEQDHSNHETERCFLEPSLTVFEQGQMFFQNAPPYLVAEIACVRDYLCRRIRGMFELAEDAAVNALQAGCPNPKTLQQARDWDKVTGEGYGCFYDDECRLFAILGKCYQDFRIEHLLSLGLPYIQTIMQARGNERESLILRNGIHCGALSENEFLTAALGLDSMTEYDETYGSSRENLNSYMTEESRRQAPPGWLWAHADCKYSGLVDRSWKGLRDWGYVFWDLERLQNAGILDRDPHDVKRVKFDENLAMSMPSVEERWLGRLALDEGLFTDSIEEVEDNEEGKEDGEEEDSEEDEEDEEEQEGEREEEGEEGEETGHSGDEVYEEERHTVAAKSSSSFFKKMREWMQHAFSAIVKMGKALRRWKTSCDSERD